MSCQNFFFLDFFLLDFFFIFLLLALEFFVSELNLEVLLSLIKKDFDTGSLLTVAREACNAIVQQCCSCIQSFYYGTSLDCANMLQDFITPATYQQCNDSFTCHYCQIMEYEHYQFKLGQCDTYRRQLSSVVMCNSYLIQCLAMVKSPFPATVKK